MHMLVSMLGCNPSLSLNERARAVQCRVYREEKEGGIIACTMVMAFVPEMRILMLSSAKSFNSRK